MSRVEATQAPSMPVRSSNGGRQLKVPVHLLTTRRQVERRPPSPDGPVHAAAQRYPNTSAARARKRSSASAVLAAASGLRAAPSGLGRSTGRFVKKNGSESVTSPLGGIAEEAPLIRRMASLPGSGKISK